MLGECALAIFAKFVNEVVSFSRIFCCEDLFNSFYGGVQALDIVLATAFFDLFMNCCSLCRTQILPAISPMFEKY